MLVNIMENDYLTINNTNELDSIPELDAGFDTTELSKFSLIKDTEESLETDIHKYILETYPDYYHTNITKPKKTKIDHMSKFFTEFRDIEREKHKHNLKWALKKASDEFTYDQLKKAQPPIDCFGTFDVVVSEVRKVSKSKINNLSRRFSLLSLAVSLLDIMVSVVLILMVTMLSHFGDKVFNTVVFSTLFIALVALAKVSLDRFAIIPLIDRYGWKLFDKSINYAREESIKINAMYCVLMESIARHESIETRYNIIHKHRIDLISKNKDFTMVNRTSGKLSEVKT